MTGCERCRQWRDEARGKPCKPGERLVNEALDALVRPDELDYASKLAAWMRHVYGRRPS